MSRPRTVPRTPKARAEYRQLMGMLADLKERQRATAAQQLPAAILDFYVPKARKILIDAFADLSLDERHALAAKLMEPDDD
jgi:hypothetical protein